MHLKYRWRASDFEGLFAARQLALGSPGGLQEMELSLEASFRSAGPRALGSEGCLKRELHFLEALQAVACKLPWPYKGALSYKGAL